MQTTVTSSVCGTLPLLLSLAISTLAYRRSQQASLALDNDINTYASTDLSNAPWMVMELNEPFPDITAVWLRTPNDESWSDLANTSVSLSTSPGLAGETVHRCGQVITAASMAQLIVVDCVGAPVDTAFKYVILHKNMTNTTHSRLGVAEVSTWRGGGAACTAQPIALRPKFRNSIHDVLIQAGRQSACFSACMLIFVHMLVYGT